MAARCRAKAAEGRFATHGALPVLGVEEGNGLTYIDHCIAGNLSASDTYALMPGTLIVDDSPEVRSIIRTFLETRAGMVVCGEAGNGAQAIEQAKKLRPDLILLDLAMPAMNGVEAASVLKRMLPRTKIVVFSMYDEMLGKALASAVGIDLMLPKVNGLTGLEESLQALHRRDIRQNLPGD